MNITLIGGGNMASAMIGGLLKQRWKAGAIRVVEVAAPARARLARAFKVKTFPALDAAAVRAAECIVLAIKPQQVREVARELGPLLSGQIVLSIAAGIRLVDLARWLRNEDCVLVRAMPNTPALIGAGIAGLASHGGTKKRLTPRDRKRVEAIMGAVGSVFWVQGEEDLDAITAVSGSGPAYVFYFMEALDQAAAGLGLPPETARRLALETFSGAARLALSSADPVATLRERVTSKGGTTERALASMEGDRVKEAIVRAVRAAAERSRELGEELGKD